MTSSAEFGPSPATVPTQPDRSPEEMPKLPPLHSSLVRLRILQPEDYPFLRSAETSGDLLARWRFRGATPSPEQWVAATGNGVLAQFLVEAAANSRPVGLVAAYQANYQDGYAYIAATRLTPAKRAPLVIFGLRLFIDYVFAAWDFRKLYMEMPAYNLAQFASGEGTFFHEEARLRDHVYLGGQYWDQVTVAIYRDQWRVASGSLGQRSG